MGQKYNHTQLPEVENMVDGFNFLKIAEGG